MSRRHDRLRALLGAATLTLALTACTAEADTSNDRVLPAESGKCPTGFAQAVTGFWTSAPPTTRIDPDRVGLHGLREHIACIIAVHHQRPARRGALIVIRDDAPPKAVTRTLTRLGYRAHGRDLKVWRRAGARAGAVTAMTPYPYHSWFDKLLPSVTNHQYALKYRLAFGDNTTTFYATFRPPPKRKPLPPLFPPATSTPTPTQTPVPPPVSAWSCWYEPTMDDDWHNDIVCSNGTEGHRPYLREWDSFVTYDEIMASAREYQAHLNS